MFKPKEFLLLVLGTVLIVVCSTVPALAEDSITISYRTPASSMHPHAQRTNTEATICKALFDTLIDRDSEGNLIPSLATSWEMTSPTVWRFNLRQGVKWQNGKEFTAEDVIYTFKVGGNPISRFKFITDKVKEVKKIDDYTIDIVTHNPWPLLPDSLYLSLFIMSKDYCEEKSEEELAENPMGTGAYKLVEWVRESHVVLEAFSDHWRGPAPIKKINLKPISNDSTRLAGLITGSTDMTIDVPVQFVDKLTSAPNINLVTTGGPRVIFLSMQMENYPTAKLKVRQAIYQSINEQSINNKLLNGKAVVANQLPHPAHRGYNPNITRPKYDSEGAKKLLAEAGYPDGLDLDIYVPNNRYIRDKDIGVAIAQQLSKANINVNLVARSYTIHFNEIRQKKLPIYMIGWEELTFDSARLLGTFVKSDAKWGWSPKNEKFDALLEKSDQIADFDERDNLLQKLNKMVMDNVWVIPLHYQPNIYGVSKNIKFTPNVKKIVTLSKLSFKK